MARKKEKPLTDEEFISSIRPRLKHKNGSTWILYGILECGYGDSFKQEAERLVSICKDSGTDAEIVESHGWWLHYKTYYDSRRDSYLNYTILSIRGQIPAL